MIFKLIIITTYFICPECEPKIDYGHAYYYSMKECQINSRKNTLHKATLYDGTFYNQIAYCEPIN